MDLLIWQKHCHFSSSNFGGVLVSFDFDCFGLQTASEVKGDLRFELSDLNYPCCHASQASKCLYGLNDRRLWLWSIDLLASSQVEKVANSAAMQENGTDSGDTFISLQQSGRASLSLLCGANLTERGWLNESDLLDPPCREFLLYHG